MRKVAITLKIVQIEEKSYLYDRLFFLQTRKYIFM